MRRRGLPQGVKSRRCVEVLHEPDRLGALDPVNIGSFGAPPIVARLDSVAHPIEQARVRRFRRPALLAHPRDTAARGQRRMVAWRACLPDGRALDGTIRDRHQAPQGPNQIHRTDSIARGSDCGRSSSRTSDHDFEAELEPPIRLQVVAGPRNHL
jgi:hypothetical protein